MKNLIQGSFVAAALSLSLQALAGGTGGPHHPDPTPTEAQAAGTDDDGSMTAEGGVDLKADLRLDDATAAKVASVLASARDQGKDVKSQMKTAVVDLHRARNANDAQAMKTSLDALKGLHERLLTLEHETVDRVMAQLSLQQQADFVLWITEKHRDRLLGGDQA